LKTAILLLIPTKLETTNNPHLPPPKEKNGAHPTPLMKIVVLKLFLIAFGLA
jgi:hypothetical protein